MKIIDLLNKIAKEEEVPETIKYHGMEYYWKSIEKDYRDMKLDCLFEKLFTLPTNFLNDEVEIIEDKKIEKLSILTYSDLIDMTLEELVDVIKEQRFKINEIIDHINKEDK